MNGEREAAKIMLAKFASRWNTMNEFQQKKADTILRRHTRELEKFMKLIEPKK
jgi:hypothetical protein